MPSLINSDTTKESIFREIADLRLHRSACVTFCDQVIAIGGSKFDYKANEAKSSNAVYVYDPDLDVWIETKNCLKTKRCYCLAATFDTGNRSRLMVVGGYTSKPDENCTNTVEIAEVRR